MTVETNTNYDTELAKRYGKPVYLIEISGVASAYSNQRVLLGAGEVTFGGEEVTFGGEEVTW